MEVFTGKTIDAIVHNIGNLLADYRTVIDTTLQEEGSISISLPIKLKGNSDQMIITAGVGFTKAKIKDTVTFELSSQREMFDDEAGYQD